MSSTRGGSACVPLALIVLSSLLDPAGHFARADTEVDPVRGELLVVVASGSGALDEAFQRDALPRLESLAKTLAIPLRTVEAAPGVPPEVTITPMIIFQNFRGRAIYQGRFTTPDRLEHFIHTVRHIPQTASLLEREDVLLWSEGRARVAAVLKVTPLEGSVPEGTDAAGFPRRAREMILAGFQKLQRIDRVALRRGDRTFYLDCYPYVGADEQLYVSSAIFSQFNCEIPVYERKESPVSGPWAERATVFAEVATVLEENLVRQFSSATTGDGLRPVGDTVAIRTWEALGISLPRSPTNAPPATDASRWVLPRSWRVEKRSRHDAPPIHFHFQEPLDYYAGSVRGIQGELVLNTEKGLGGASGWVEANTSSLSMGDPDLDASLHSSEVFDVAKHPTARFVIASVASEPDPLAFGELRTAVLHGEFTLKGMTIPIQARVIFQPAVGAGGERKLLVTGSFPLRLEESFGISGPDGPAPANDTVVVGLDFTMVPRSLSELPNTDSDGD